MTSPTTSHALLPRVVGVGGAVMIGLGSIIGTGVFVTIGIAAGHAGPAVILAIVIAAMLAICNGLSSAQLAGNHPVSGGTYEYGYRYLNPTLGFTAGWTFLAAKTASAATTAMGFAGYVLSMFGAAGLSWQRPVAVGALVVITVLVLSGLKKSNLFNTIIVCLSLTVLLFFVAICAPGAMERGSEHLTPFFKHATTKDVSPMRGLLYATALMFVAYTGYGRIATMGEEIANPRRSIPIVMIVTLGVSMLLYVAVAVTGIAAVGVDGFAIEGKHSGMPLENVARLVRGEWAATVMSVGAIAAMLGVLLNVTQGMSRTVLAMGRRRDLPGVFARLDTSGVSPRPAVLLIAAIVLLFILFGDIESNWSFSAFTVLVYYAITNLAALRLGAAERFFPRWIAVAGLIGCLFLAFWVEPRIWMLGLGVIATGLIGRKALRHGGREARSGEQANSSE